MLLDNTALDRALEILIPEDFYREVHRKIMRAILSLSERHEPVDLVTLADALRSRNELQDVGGAAYLAELAERVPTAANVGYYARIVKDRAILRALMQTTTEIASRCYEPPGRRREISRRGRAQHLRNLRAQDPPCPSRGCATSSSSR